MRKNDWIKKNDNERKIIKKSQERFIYDSRFIM